MEKGYAADIARDAALVALPLASAWVGVRLARRIIPRSLARLSDVARAGERAEARTRTLSTTLIGATAVVLWTIALLTSLGKLGLPLAPLLAGAGTVGLAVGFGAQQLVRDVIGGFFILVEDQYGVGDEVSLNGVTGTIESMSLRLTRVRGDDGVLHHLRNGDLAVVSNLSRGWAAVTVTLPVAAGADLDDVTERLRVAMADVVESGRLDDELLGDPQVLGVSNVTKDGGTVEINARTTPEARSKVERALTAAALAALRPGAPRRTAARKPAKKTTARRR